MKPTFINEWKSKLYKRAFSARLNHFHTRVKLLDISQIEYIKNPYLFDHNNKSKK